VDDKRISESIAIFTFYYFAVSYLIIGPVTKEKSITSTVLEIMAKCPTERSHPASLWLHLHVTSVTLATPTCYQRHSGYTYTLPASLWLHLHVTSVTLATPTCYQRHSGYTYMLPASLWLHLHVIFIHYMFCWDPYPFDPVDASLVYTKVSQ